MVLSFLGSKVEVRDPKTNAVTDTISCKNVIIATGARTRMFPSSKLITSMYGLPPMQFSKEKIRVHSSLSAQVQLV
jgi:pyruvate/2-oxoglutarate dehydrogenase complex dihydrolipoamide dehydrogenase (E3) component